MSEVPNRNGRAPSGLGDAGPEELWNRLRDATRQARALADQNRQLTDRVAFLEHQLAAAGGRSDEDAVGELPRRVAVALQSAQEVADEVIGRAKQREEKIRRMTDTRARAVVEHAESEATAVLQRAAGEAVKRVNDARAEAHSIVGGARARGAQMLSDLEAEAEALEERVRRLRAVYDELAGAYAVIERTLDQARAALGSPADGRSRDGDPRAAWSPPASQSGPPARLRALNASADDGIWPSAPSGA